MHVCLITYYRYNFPSMNYKEFFYDFCISFAQDDIVRFGIDGNGPLPNPAWGEDVSQLNAIEVPEVHLTIYSNEIHHRLMQFDPLVDSQNFGIDIYLHVVEYLDNLHQNVLPQAFIFFEHLDNLQYCLRLLYPYN